MTAAMTKGRTFDFLLRSVKLEHRLFDLQGHWEPDARNELLAAGLGHGAMRDEFRSIA